MTPVPSSILAAFLMFGHVLVLGALESIITGSTLLSSALSTLKSFCLSEERPERTASLWGFSLLIGQSGNRVTRRDFLFTAERRDWETRVTDQTLRISDGYWNIELFYK